MPKQHLIISITLALSLNLLSLYVVVRILRKYSYIKEETSLSRSLRKAYMSKKKREIVTHQVRRIRGAVFKLSFFQFFIPTATFIVSLFLYIPIALALFPGQDPLQLSLDKPCIAPIPIQIPEPPKGCTMSVSWVFFLVFLLFLPLYMYYARKYLES